jgi:hypothetical protein
VDPITLLAIIASLAIAAVVIIFAWAGERVDVAARAEFDEGARLAGLTPRASVPTDAIAVLRCSTSHLLRPRLDRFRHCWWISETNADVWVCLYVAGMSDHQGVGSAITAFLHVPGIDLPTMDLQGTYTRIRTRDKRKQAGGVAAVIIDRDSGEAYRDLDRELRLEVQDTPLWRRHVELRTSCSTASAENLVFQTLLPRATGHS